MRTSAYWFFGIALLGCAAPPPPPPAPVEEPVAPAEEQGPEGTRYAGGDGMSCDTPVLILGAKTAVAGIKAQHAWILKRYPKSRNLARDSMRCQEKPVERIIVAAPGGEQVEVFFDISDYIDKS